MDNFPQSIAVTDTEGNVALWNQGMEEKFLSKQKALGKPLRNLLPHLWEEYQGNIWGELFMKEVIRKGEIREWIRYPMPMQDGHIRYFHIQGSPLKGSDGQTVGGILQLSDVTDNLRRENQMLRRARTDSLSDLGASIAHEIRNPLNSISLNIQLIKEGLEHPAECSREEMIDTASNVLAEIARLNGIIRQFLDFSRGRQPRLELDDVNETVLQVVKLLSKEARRANVEIIVNLAPLPLVFIDRNLLLQAIYNILLNAIQATKGVGGGRVECTSLKTKEYILLEFKDDGPGFSPETQTRMFDLFYSTKEDGTGLGLPIANQIVEKHEGRIVAENNLDRGANFSIYLPLPPRFSFSTGDKQDKP